MIVTVLFMRKQSVTVMSLSVLYPAMIFPVTVPPAAAAGQSYQQPHFSTLAPCWVNDLGPLVENLYYCLILPSRQRSRSAVIIEPIHSAWW